MKKVIKHIKDKELFFFFGLAFLISWGVWIIVPFITNNSDIQRIINMIGVFGPALAAIIVSGVNDPSVRRVSATRFWIYFSISFVIVYVISILSLERVLNMKGEPLVYFLLTIIAIIASIILTGSFSRNRGIANLLKSLKLSKIAFKWYFVVLLLLPIIQVVSVVIDVLIGGEFDYSFYQIPWYEFIYSAVIGFVAILIFGGSLNEEPGWRGFALPRLLKKFSPLMASIILGLIWSLWHGPLHFNGFYNDGMEGFLSRFIWNIPLTIFFTWVYLKTTGSILHAVLLHTSINTVGLLLPISSRAGVIMVIILGVMLISIIIRNRMWKKELFLM